MSLYNALMVYFLIGFLIYNIAEYSGIVDKTLSQPEFEKYRKSKLIVVGVKIIALMAFTVLWIPLISIGLRNHFKK